MSFIVRGLQIWHMNYIGNIEYLSGIVQKEAVRQMRTDPRLTEIIIYLK